MSGAGRRALVTGGAGFVGGHLVEGLLDAGWSVRVLIRLIDRHDADLVVFDNNLSPAQGQKLEDATRTIIVDRSEVILDLFATRAQTYEAMLQVELAQRLYFRTRLKRMWTHLERIEGGIGTGRGPGEKQLETDRRLIDRRVAELRRKPRQIEKRRERTVAARRNHRTVSLVGYTNAGKSTLMNALTNADLLVADKLFATLDTRTRQLRSPNPVWPSVRHEAGGARHRANLAIADGCRGGLHGRVDAPTVDSQRTSVRAVL